MTRRLKWRRKDSGKWRRLPFERKAEWTADNQVWPWLKLSGDNCGDTTPALSCHRFKALSISYNLEYCHSSLLILFLSHSFYSALLSSSLSLLTSSVCMFNTQTLLGDAFSRHIHTADAFRLGHNRRLNLERSSSSSSSGNRQSGTTREPDTQARWNNCELHWRIKYHERLLTHGQGCHHSLSARRFTGPIHSVHIIQCQFHCASPVKEILLLLFLVWLIVITCLTHLPLSGHLAKCIRNKLHQLSPG